MAAKDDDDDEKEAPPKKKKSKLPLIIGAAVLLLLLGGGLGYYFLVMKPAAEAKIAAEAAAAAAEALAEKNAPVVKDANGNIIKKHHHKKKPKPDKPEPPAYINLEPFTVNLADTEQEHYLQATLVLQVTGDAAAEDLKKHMALIRDRTLKLLSSSKSADLRSVEGKQKVADAIIEDIANAADDEKLEIPDIDRVFFTAFIIQ